VTSQLLEAVAERLSGVRWMGAEGARYLRAHCPFHDDEDPSLLVNPRRFKCLAVSCGRSGTTEWLLRYLEGHPVVIVGGKMRRPAPAVPWMPEATDKERLEEFAISAHLALLSARERGQLGRFLERRGIAGRIEPQMLGWYLGWYVVPVFSAEYDVETVVLRASEEVQRATGQRYAVAPGTRGGIYVPDWRLAEAASFLVFAFGITDALTLVELGVSAAAPLTGCQRLDAAWLECFRKPILLWPHVGEETAAERLRADLDWRGRIIRYRWPRGCGDVNDLLVEGRTDDILSAIDSTLKGR